jgi:hypothetical protein
MWLLLQNRIWTADSLLAREWPNSIFCPLCWKNLETAQHLFAECPASCFIWRSVAAWTRSSTSDPDNWKGDQEILDWFTALVDGMSSDGAKGTRSLAILVIWSIWCERNARIFNDKEKKLARLVDEIKESANLCSTRAKHMVLLVGGKISE